MTKRVKRDWPYEKSVVHGQSPLRLYPGLTPYATKRKIKRGHFDKVENKSKRK